MLTTNAEETTDRISTAPFNGPKTTGEPTSSDKSQSRLAQALTIEWLGQTLASLCWIASMLTYGISSGGAWLQLLAASAWFIANVASITNAEAT